MSGLRRFLIAAFALQGLAGAAAAAEVIVAKEAPEHAQPRFFERIQADGLAEAIAKRGQPVDVKPGEYHLRVPCDSMKAGSFTDITVTVDEKSTTRLRLVECGVLMDNHQ